MHRLIYCNITCTNHPYLGYSKLYFRFAQQGDADPSNWKGVWNEHQYVQNWAFICNARGIIEENKGAMAVVYDLGVELGGIWANNIPANATYRYTIRMWEDYAMLFKTRGNTFGFSFAGGNANIVNMRVASQLAAYQTTDETPFMWTLDVYGDELAQLTAMSQTGLRAHLLFVVLLDLLILRAHVVPQLSRVPGEVTKPFVILECFYDDVR